MNRSLITLTTDFGLRDPYVAEMKAVILGICPSVTIVDVSHQVEKFNIRMGAYVLASACPYFPEDTIHVAVVDPGVGTKRRALCIETRRGMYVGPDNGVLVLAAQAEGIRRTYEIRNPKLMLPSISDTFHGRDVFSPVAAHLAKGARLSDLGPETDTMVIPEFAKVVKQKDKVVGEAVHIDEFGNVVTNIRKTELESIAPGKEVRLIIKDSLVTMDFCKTYADVKAKRPVALFGSHKFLEISVNQGNAARVFKVKVGDKVTVFRS